MGTGAIIRDVGRFHRSEIKFLTLRHLLAAVWSHLTQIYAVKGKNKGAKVKAQDGTGQLNYCSHRLMKDQPSRGGSVGAAVLTAASCLHDLICKDMPLLIASRMPTVENRLKCTSAVRYLAAAE